VPKDPGNEPADKGDFCDSLCDGAMCVDAIKAGAFNYLSKPFELDELLIVMDLAVKNVQMEGKIRVRTTRKLGKARRSSSSVLQKRCKGSEIKSGLRPLRIRMC